MNCNTVLVPKYKSPITMIIVNDYSLVTTETNGHQNRYFYLDAIINYSNETFRKSTYKIEEHELEDRFTCFEV